MHMAQIMDSQMYYLHRLSVMFSCYMGKAKSQEKMFLLQYLLFPVWHEICIITGCLQTFCPQKPNLTSRQISHCLLLISEGRVRYCGPAHPCCSENQIAVVKSSSFSSIADSRSWCCVCILPHRRGQAAPIRDLGAPDRSSCWDSFLMKGQFASRDIRICFVVSPGGGLPDITGISQAGTLTLEAQGLCVPS